MNRTYGFLALGSAVAGLGAILAISAEAQAPIPIPSVWLQSSTPGTVQTGHANISGTFASTNMVLKGGSFIGNMAGNAYTMANNGGGYLSSWGDPAFSLAARFGTSSDDSGFGEMRSKAGAIVMLFEGDDDNNGANGTETGALEISSVGTGGPGGQFRILNNDGASTFTVSGGGSGALADLNFLSGANSVFQVIGSYGGFGGALYLKEESGAATSRFEPDVDGSGQFVLWARGAGGNGLIYDGNAVGNNPTLALLGASTVNFDMTTSGNASVVLPANAIDSGEMFDEPGVANDHVTSTAMPASYGALTSRTITVPAAGYVLVMAQGDLVISHTAGNSNSAVYGVSTSATALPVDQDIQTQMPTAAPSGVYDFSASAHGLFTVSAGANTFYFTGRLTGTDTGTMFDINLTLVYIPTAYGTVVSNFTGGGGGGQEDSGDLNDHSSAKPPLTEDDIDYEKRQAAVNHQMRFNDELAAMKAQMAALQMKMAQIERRQGSYQKATPRHVPGKGSNLER